MIIVDQNTPLRNKSDDAQSPQAEPIAPPPAYPGYQSTSQVQTPMIASYSVHPPRETAARRFTKAFLVALLIWTLVGIFTRSAVELMSHRHTHWVSRRFITQDGDDEDWNGWPVTPAPVTLEGDERIKTCVYGEDWTPIEGPPPHTGYGDGYWANSKFELPFTSDVLFFVARGALAAGDLQVVESEDVDDVKVNVDVFYYTRTALSRTRVCSLRRGDGKDGLGIFTPLRWKFPSRSSRRRDILQFVVTVTLPSGGPKPFISAFETSLHLFKHTFKDLSPIEFGSVSLRTSNMPMYFDVSIFSIVARHVDARSSNGPIIGEFNTSSHLELRTSNSPIKVVVGALHDTKERPTDVVLSTTNGHVQRLLTNTGKANPLLSSAISAILSLFSTASDEAGGAFNVAARSTNSPVEVVTVDSPADSILHLAISTTNSPVRATLHPAYEGTFVLSTTNFIPIVKQDEGVEDPTGRGRERNVQVKSVRNRVLNGEVTWIPSEHEGGTAGSVSLRTTNSPAVLTL
ncbi:hypothetical protein BV25DRAFT_1794551 [Artomyces pyxidatus]|uniref:Uncharacterized protein n=1 Tax=Artomyces pyxidatus TaxID=48021 RepID=A0ACB8TGP4_9AGAM|nr:hypothetical protein BV25DRAFT_1794551 [Artomyces pyxidatus]